MDPSEELLEAQKIEKEVLRQDNVIIDASGPAIYNSKMMEFQYCEEGECEN